MKKIYNIFVVALLAMVALTGCSKEDPFSSTADEEVTGQLSMKKMLVEITNEENVVRSSIDINTFMVTISDTDTDVVAGSYQYKDMPEVITLPVGNYEVVVKSHDVKDAAWDEPYFEGSQTFTIKENEITEVNTVVCSLANVRVTIKYDEKLKAAMAADCKVNVVVGDKGMLEFTRDEVRSGYFKYVEGSTSMVATFSGTVQDNYEENFRTYVDVAPGNHYIITYTLHSPSGDVPDMEGQINFGLTVDATVTTENLTVNVETEEEIIDPTDRPQEDDGPDDPINPDPDDPDDTKELPTVEAVAPITFDSPNVVNAESTVVVNVQSHHADGITEFKVEIVSDAISELLNAQLGTSELDFINPANDNVKNFISQLNLVDGEVAGRTDLIEIKISGFMSMLSALGAGTHDFIITVGDANGTVVKTLTLVIE